MENLSKYIFQAIDNYPFDLESTVEALEYALSEEPESVPALILAGRLYMDYLQDYVSAIGFFEEALTVDIKATAAYEYYIDALLAGNEYAKADKFILFAYGIKGSDKALLLYKKALLLERLLMYKPALKHIRKALLLSYKEDLTEKLQNEKKRIKKKLKM